MLYLQESLCISILIVSIYLTLVQVRYGTFGAHSGGDTVGWLRNDEFNLEVRLHQPNHARVT